MVRRTGSNVTFPSTVHCLSCFSLRLVSLTSLLTCLLTSLLTCLLTSLLTCLLTYLLIDLLTPCIRVLLEKLTGFQLLKKFPAFYGTRMFITAFTSARHLSLFWASSIQSIQTTLTKFKEGTSNWRLKKRCNEEHHDLYCPLNTGCLCVNEEGGCNTATAALLRDSVTDTRCIIRVISGGGWEGWDM